MKAKPQISLIQPPVRDFYYTSIRRQPLGLLYLAAALENDFSIELIDGHSKKSSELSLPPDFDYLRKFIGHEDPRYRFPFGPYKHFGKSFDHIRGLIKKSSSTFFLVSAMFTPYHKESEQIIAMIREYHPDRTIIVGGAHATLYPEHLLRNHGIDFVILGEGEVVTKNLLLSLLRGEDPSLTDSIAFLRDGELVRNRRCLAEDIDTILFPARELIKPESYRIGGKRLTSLLASRGCENNCRFCTGPIVWGRRRRRRTLANIEQEIDRCCRRYGTGIINFEDENLFAFREEAYELISLLKTKHQRYGIEYTAMNGLSIEKIDPSMIGEIAEAGFREINLSLVTASAKKQKELGRPFGTEHFDEIVTAAKNADIKVRAYFILGLPGDTVSSTEETITFLEKRKIGFYPSVYYNVMDKAPNWKKQRSSAFFNTTPELPRRELIALFNRCHAILNKLMVK